MKQRVLKVTATVVIATLLALILTFVAPPTANSTKKVIITRNLLPTPTFIPTLTPTLDITPTIMPTPKPIPTARSPFFRRFH